MTSNVIDKDIATIFDIQRFSVHDGPGIRTLIFFKGCSLQCAWCQNPESIRPQKEMAFYEDRCIGCYKCEDACSYGAILKDIHQRIDWGKCTACGDCAEVCPENAIRIVGKSYSAQELLEECLKDKTFYDASGGGITLSGGEPVLHVSFLERFLSMVKENTISVLLETAGNYPFSLLESILSFIDCIYYDYKLPGSDEYRQYTGSDNKRIIENIKRLLSLSFPLDIRIPLIPGINTTPEQIAQMCETLSNIGIKEVHLLKYNFLWEAKIPRLNTKQRVMNLSDNILDYDKIKEYFNMHSIKALL